MKIRIDRFYAISRYPSKWEIALALFVEKPNGNASVLHAYLPTTFTEPLANLTEAQAEADKLNVQYQLPQEPTATTVPQGASSDKPIVKDPLLNADGIVVG